MPKSLIKNIFQDDKLERRKANYKTLEELDEKSNWKESNAGEKGQYVAKTFQDLKNSEYTVMKCFEIKS